MSDETKVCTKCGEEKSLGEFRKDASKKSGYGSQCKECVAKHKREKILRDPDLAERLRQENREFYKLDTKFKENKYKKKKDRYAKDTEYRNDIVKRERERRFRKRDSAMHEYFMKLSEARSWFSQSDEEADEDVSRGIRLKRKSIGLTQSSLAAVCGLRENSIYRAESCRYVSGDTIIRIYEGLLKSMHDKTGRKNDI